MKNMINKMWNFVKTDKDLHLMTAVLVIGLIGERIIDKTF